MAIAFDSSSSGYSVGAASTTKAHTCSGADRILFTGVLITNGGPITGVTYNGVAMTKLGTTITLSNNYKTELYYLIAPDTGTNNVVASKTSSTGNIFIVNASYTGVSQTGFPDASTEVDYVNTATATTSLTTVADNAWVVLYAGNEGVVPAAGTSTTHRESTIVVAWFDSNAAITPAGSTSLQTTQNGTTDTAHYMVSIAPAGGGGGGGFAFSQAVVIA